MKKLFLILFLSILLIGSVSAVKTIEWDSGIGGFSTSVGLRAANTYSGIKIIMNTNATLESIGISNPSSFSTIALLNSAKSILNTTTLSGYTANFNGVNLTAGTTYYIGATDTVDYSSYGNNTASFPYNSSIFNWTGGLVNGVDSSVSAENIFNLSFFTTTIPLILTPTLISPLNNSGLSTTGTNFTANYTTTSTDLNLTNVTYYVWYSNGTIFNNSEIVTITGISNSSNRFIDKFTLNSYIWNVYACGVNATGTQCSWANNNFTFDVGATVNSIYQNNGTFETSLETFLTNITLLNGTNFYASKLIYNGTSYDGTINNINGNDYQISKKIDIPLFNSQVNISWFWNLIYEKSDGSFLNQNLSSNTQTVNIINISSCSGQVNTTLLNFTAWNEEDLTNLKPYDFYGTFDYWLGGGSVKKNISFSNTNVNSKSICSKNITHQFKSDATVQYEKTNFIKRSYYLVNNSLTNITQNISLYFLNTSSSTSFIIDILDQNQLAIEGAYIYIQRYYPGTGTFNTIEMAKTNKAGSTIGHFEAETEDYRIIVQKNQQVIYESEIQKIFCREVPCTLTFQTNSNTKNIWNNVGNLSNFIHNLNYNETTKLWKYTYIDTSGTTHYGRLYVYYNDPSLGEISICNINSTSTSASLICNVTGYNGTIYAKSFISRSPEILTNLKSIVGGLVKNVFGKAGLFLSLFIILTLALAGIWNPTVGILLVLAGIIIINFIGLASFGSITLVGIIFIGIILIWKLKT